MYRASRIVSDEVIRRIVARTSQKTKVACCLASKALCDVLMHPTVWRKVRLHTFDEHALQFVCRVRPAVLRLVSDDGCAVAAFLEALVQGGAHAHVHGLHIAIGSVPPHNALMSAVCDYVHLQEVFIECSAAVPACLAFPEEECALADLRFVGVIENGRNNGRNVEVYFHQAELPALEEVVVSASTCDVLAAAWRFPKLKSIKYSGRDEFEDARLDQCHLRLLSVATTSPRSFDNLICAMQRAAHIQDFALAASHDIVLESRIPVRNVHMRLVGFATTITVVLPIVRGITSFACEHADERDWCVKFARAGSWAEFCWWMRSTTLRVGLGGGVAVDP